MLVEILEICAAGIAIEGAMGSTDFEERTNGSAGTCATFGTRADERRQRQAARARRVTSFAHFSSISMFSTTQGVFTLRTWLTTFPTLQLNGYKFLMTNNFFSKEHKFQDLCKKIWTNWRENEKKFFLETNGVIPNL